MENADERIKSMMQKIESLSEDCRNLAREMDKETVYSQSEQLKAVLSQREKELAELRDTFEGFYRENQKLKQAVAAQVLTERGAILNASQKKVEQYLNGQATLTRQMLDNAELQLKDRISSLYSDAQKNINLTYSSLVSEFNSLSAKVFEETNRLRNNLSQTEGELRGYTGNVYGQLHSGEVSQADIARNIKRKDVEFNFGLHWFNWAGIILILLGVITFAGYTYLNWFNNIGKGVMLFAFSLIVLTLGEVFLRKKENLFLKGVVSLGIGCLYASTFIAYFLLHILNMPAALSLALITAAISLLLTRLHNSRTITVFTLIGGYLPVIAFNYLFWHIDLSLILMMLYILLLNLAVITTSCYQKWNVTKYAAFGMGMLVYIMTYYYASSTFVNVAYSVFMFLLFTFIQILYPIRQKSGKLLAGDIIVLGLNTVITATFCYLIFDWSPALHGFKGLLSVGYAAAFFLLGLLASRLRKESKETPWLFFTAALSFLALAVPFQLGFIWWPCGWLAEGLVILLFSIRFRKKVLEVYAWAVCLLAYFVAGIHLLVNLSSGFDSAQYQFEQFFFALGSVIILLAYNVFFADLPRKSSEKVCLRIFKYFAVLQTYCYLLSELHRLTSLPGIQSGWNPDYLFALTAALLLIAYGLLLPRIRPLSDRGMIGISSAAKFLYAFLSLIYTLAFFVFHRGTAPGVILFVAMVAATALACWVLASELKKLMNKNTGEREARTLILSIYILLVEAVIILSQLRWFSLNQFLLNLLLMASAFVTIFLGFRQQLVYIRRVGLGLSFLICLKLFVFDLSSLSVPGRIVSFFVLGGICFGISYIYQRFSKKYAVIGQEPEKEQNNKFDQK